MFYEPYQKKKRRGPRRRVGCGAWLLGALARLLAAALALVIVAAAVLYAAPPALFAVEPEGNDLALTDGLPAGMANVLLLGVDYLRDSAQRSDSMIIASVGYGKLRLTSVMRDAVLDIPSHGAGKLNAAYAYGGAALTMKTLNANLGLNLMRYATVDFVSLVRIVDAMGGVEVDITEAEMREINRNVWSARRIFRPLGYTATELKTFGERTRLNGLQALGYARIRKIDSDYTRTQRQRKLLNALVRRLRDNAWNPMMWVELARTLPDAVDTNMSLPELISLAEKALVAGDVGQQRLPVDGSFTDNGSSLKIHDMGANARAFREFVYGAESERR